MDKIEQTQNQKKREKLVENSPPLEKLIFGWRINSLQKGERKQQAGPGEERDWPSRDVGK